MPFSNFLNEDAGVICIRETNGIHTEVEVSFDTLYSNKYGSVFGLRNKPFDRSCVAV